MDKDCKLWTTQKEMHVYKNKNEMTNYQKHILCEKDRGAMYGDNPSVHTESTSIWCSLRIDDSMRGAIFKMGC